MSAVGDAFNALKNVMLMQERMDGLRGDIGRTSADLRSLTEKVFSVDKRVTRLEGFIEGAAAASGRSSKLPEIEG